MARRSMGRGGWKEWRGSVPGPKVLAGGFVQGQGARGMAVAVGVFHEGSFPNPVLHRGRRTGEPFGGEGIPGVVACLLTCAKAPDHIEKEWQSAEGHQEGSHTAQLVEGGEGGIVFSHAPGHTVEA